MIEPVAFARSINLYKAPCSSLVTAWLRYNGVENVPTDSQCRKLWFSVGTERGMEIAAQQMGLLDGEPAPGAIALLWQANDDPLLSIVVKDNICVARSFGVLYVGKSKVLRAWCLNG